MPEQLPLFDRPPIKVRDLTEMEQSPLFRMPPPSATEIRALVKARLYGFEIRQAARAQKRARKGRSANG